MVRDRGYRPLPGDHRSPRCRSDLDRGGRRHDHVCGDAPSRRGHPARLCRGRLDHHDDGRYRRDAGAGARRSTSTRPVRSSASSRRSLTPVPTRSLSDSSSARRSGSVGTANARCASSSPAPAGSSVPRRHGAFATRGIFSTASCGDRPRPGDAFLEAGGRRLDVSGLPGNGLSGVSAVFIVAGEPMTPRRWGPDKTEAILASRIATTDAIARAIARSDTPPPALVSMSAIGIYGDHGAEVVDETTPAGTGFVAEVLPGMGGGDRSRRGGRDARRMDPHGNRHRPGRWLRRHRCAARAPWPRGTPRRRQRLDELIALDDAVDVLVFLATHGLPRGR